MLVLHHQGESGKAGERGPAGAVGPVVSTRKPPEEAIWLILKVTGGNWCG